MLFTSLYSPLADGVNAIGKMKYLNLFSVCNYFSFLIVWYVLMKMSATPTVIYSTLVLSEIFVYIAYITILKAYTGFNILSYLLNDTFKVLLIFTTSLSISYFIHNCITKGIVCVIIVMFCSLCISISMIFWIGLEKSVRTMVFNKITSIIIKKKNMKNKALLVTLTSGNYGTILQAYAMNIVLKNFGYYETE